MKRTILLLGAGVLAATMAFAQDSPSATSGAQDNSAQTRAESSSRSTSMIRGCLSGSSGNYTVTDSNGMQYEVSGDDGTLRSMVGREVEITVSEDRSTQDSSQSSGTTTHSTNTVQASDVRAVAASCKLGSTADDHANPKGTPDAATPKLMAMLQEPSKQSSGTDPNQASPPVTSQTPAGQSSPTNSQVGSSPANNAGMTESEANHASPNSATLSNAQQPQSNANDQNKPLYERQATDIPWANSSGGNTGTPNPPH